MRRYIQTLCVLCAAVASLTACLGSDDDTVTVYSDVAITQLTLGTLNRYTQTTSATTGNDTVVRTRLTGSNYKMTIDHLGHAIYNTTELPVGTDVKHVLCTISTKNSGVVAIRSMTSDSLSFYNASDSIDFSVPRVLRVYAIDGSAWREYTVTLNVSQTVGVNFGWTKVADGQDDLTGWTDKRLIALQDTVLLASRGTIAGTDRLSLWRLNEGGDLEYSEDDGTTWVAKTPDAALATLLGSTTHELYAMGNDGQLRHSADGTAWTTETLDDDAALLPAANTAMVCWPYAPADSTEYVFLMGRQATGDAFCTWRKLNGYAQNAEPSRWVYMPIDDSNRARLPYGDDLSLAYYDAQVLALTNTTADDGTTTINRNIYVSRDQGITWRKSKAYALPEALTGTRAVMVNDGEERLWVATDSGQLWVGARQ